MNNDKKIRYETKNQEYYRMLIKKDEIYSLLLILLIGGIILCIGILIILLNTFKVYSIYVGTFIIFSSILILSIVIFIHMKRKKKTPTKYGVFIDENGIYIPHMEKYWKFDDIDFIFIDENYHVLGGLIVIKTRKTKPITISNDLLNKPSKFWAKIPGKDKAFNIFDTDLIEDMEKFIDVLLTYGVKVYWRRKGSEYIEEVAKRE